MKRQCLSLHLFSHAMEYECDAWNISIKMIRCVPLSLYASTKNCLKYLYYNVKMHALKLRLNNAKWWPRFFDCLDAYDSCCRLPSAPRNRCRKTCNKVNFKERFVCVTVVLVEIKCGSCNHSWIDAIWNEILEWDLSVTVIGLYGQRYNMLSLGQRPLFGVFKIFVQTCVWSYRFIWHSSMVI